MMSLLHDLARDYQAALVGFWQVFAASAILVAICYWLKLRLMRKLGWQSAGRPKRQTSARRVRSRATTRTVAPPKPVSPDPVVLQPPSVAPMRISPETHSERAAALVRQVVDRSERACDLHQRSLVRLESADYAFQRLLLEVAEIIAFPQVQEPGSLPPPAEQILPEQVRRLAA